jgi:hypothetical protein
LHLGSAQGRWLTRADVAVGSSAEMLGRFE